MNKQLRLRLIEMGEADQKERFMMMADVKRLRKKYGAHEKIPQKKWRPTVKRMTTVDKKNTRELKKIIREFGWPGKSLVGKKAAKYAWLIAQHAVHDLKFMESCFELIKAGAKTGDVELKHIALMQDRLLVHAGKKQIYGSQFRGSVNGTYKPYPIRDPKNIDKRRKKMGMDSFEEYKKRLLKNN